MLLRSFSAVLLISLLSTSAYAGSGGKNVAEDKVFYNDLQQMAEPLDSSVTERLKKRSKTVSTPVSISAALPQATRSHPVHNKLKPRIEGNWRYSNDRSILMSEFWVPLAQNEQDGSVLFGDVRVMGDNNKNREFNIGAGYREVVDIKLLGEGVVGGMLWYDRRFTKRGSKFNQVTAGAEWLGEKWDVRANGYVPLNTSKTHTQDNPNGTGLGFVGNQILVNTDQSIVEEALPGVDLEIGRKLGFMDGLTDATRVYAAGYHFEGDRAEDVTGWRTRIASDITSDVQVGARFQKDDVRGSQTYLEATVRFPFGNKKSFKEEGVRSRLDESPERDIDIVNNESIADDGINKTLLNASTGNTQNVIHVDNTAGGGGDGSIETPFNTLAAAEVAATTNDLIYVHRGDGTTVGQDAGITLDDDGQMLAGSGVSLLFSEQRFATSSNLSVTNGIVVATSNTAPVITNGAGNGVDITADDIFVSGITVDGANIDGIAPINADNLNISDVTVTNSVDDGIYADYNIAGSYNISVLNSVFSNNGDDGLVAESGLSSSLKTNFSNNIVNFNNGDGIGSWAYNGGAISSRIINNIANNNARAGISVDASENDATQTALITNNVTNNNSLMGTYLASGNAGNNGTLNATYSNNTSNSNVQHGVTIDGFGNASTTVIMSNNTTNLNTQSGVRIDANNNSTVNATVRDSIMHGNTGDGIYVASSTTGTNNTDIDNIESLGNLRGVHVDAFNNGIVNATVSNGVMNDNTDQGIAAWAWGNSSMTATIENNITNNNSREGIYGFAASTADIDIDVIGNSASGNDDEAGIFVESYGNGIVDTVIKDNVVSNSAEEGYIVGSWNNSVLTAVVENNTATGNTLDGFELHAQNDSSLSISFSSNVATGNAEQGVYVWDASTLAPIVDLGGGGLGSVGNNSIYNNTLDDIRVDLDGGELKAENNWWGSTGGLLPAETFLEGASTIDSMPFLTVDPN